MAVAPIAPLVEDRRGEPDGRVVQCVGRGLRTCALEMRVGSAVLLAERPLLEHRSLGVGQGRLSRADWGFGDERNVDAQHARETRSRAGW
jgi:hypothetical protein